MHRKKCWCQKIDGVNKRKGCLALEDKGKQESWKKLTLTCLISRVCLCSRDVGANRSRRNAAAIMWILRAGAEKTSRTSAKKPPSKYLESSPIHGVHGGADMKMCKRKRQQMLLALAGVIRWSEENQKWSATDIFQVAADGGSFNHTYKLKVTFTIWP